MKPAPLVVITGAASGIGRATAERFVRDGWRVAALDRSAEGNRSHIKQKGIFYTPADLDGKPITTIPPNKSSDRFSRFRGLSKPPRFGAIRENFVWVRLHHFIA